MNKEFTLQNFKSAASKTGQILTQKGHKIPQSTLYHALAVFVGAKNWNTLQAELQSESSCENPENHISKHVTTLINQFSSQKTSYITHMHDDAIYDNTIILSEENIKHYLIKIAQAYYHDNLQRSMQSGYFINSHFLEDHVYRILQQPYSEILTYLKPILRYNEYQGKKDYDKEKTRVMFNNFDVVLGNTTKALLPLTLMNYLHDKYDIWGQPKPYHSITSQDFLSFAQDANFKDLSNYFLSFVHEDMRDREKIKYLSESIAETLVSLRKHKPVNSELINSIFSKDINESLDLIISLFSFDEYEKNINLKSEMRTVLSSCTDEDIKVFKSALQSIDDSSPVYMLDITCYWHRMLSGEKYYSLRNTISFLMEII